jgi:hypothetical protein
MVNNIAHVKLMATRLGTYSMYVFKDLDVQDNYIMCTRLPNWQVPEIQIGDAGFLEYQYVEAGQEYYDLATEKMAKYLYTNVYFINFIQKTDILQNNETIL